MYNILSKKNLQHKGQLAHLFKSNYTLKTMLQKNKYPDIQWARTRHVPPRTAGHTKYSKAYKMAQNSSIQHNKAPSTRKSRRQELLNVLNNWVQNNRKGPIQRNNNVYYNAQSNFSKGTSLPLNVQRKILNMATNPLGYELKQKKPMLKKVISPKKRVTKMNKANVPTSRLQTQELINHMARIRTPLSQRYQNQIKNCSSNRKK